MPDPPFPIGHANGVNRLIDTIEDDSNEKNCYIAYSGIGDTGAALFDPRGCILPNHTLEDKDPNPSIAADFYLRSQHGLR